jgi:hypothetical protein
MQLGGQLRVTRRCQALCRRRLNADKCVRLEVLFPGQALFTLACNMPFRTMAAVCIE